MSKVVIESEHHKSINFSHAATGLPGVDNAYQLPLVPCMYRGKDFQTLSDENADGGIESMTSSLASPGDNSSRPDRNFNANNNKKKKTETKDSNKPKGKSVNFRLSRERPYQQQNEASRSGRFHSVQLSSIRVIPRKKEQTFSEEAFLYQKNEYRKRLIEKNGRSNIVASDINRFELFSRYFNDIFTTMLDSSWSWILFLTISVYIVHWFIFGLIYWFFAYLNNDYHKGLGNAEEHYEEGIVNLIDNITHSSNKDPCVFNVHDSVSAFLFSLESETTIGYGFRTISTACPHAVICLAVQCIVSVVFDTWVIGMCYARLARPDARTRTTLFSKKAVICTRDGKRCLLVRFANLRQSLLLNVSVRARMISIRPSRESEVNSGYHGMMEQQNLRFSNSSSALLTAPIEYCHIIDKDSPLYDIKSYAYNNPNGKSFFEIVFIVTGTLESTGLTMQAQTSYLSAEILYGYRFVPIVSKCFKKRKYVVDFDIFHETVDETLWCKKPNKKEIQPSTSEISTVTEQVSKPTKVSTSVSDEVFMSENAANESSSSFYVEESAL